MIYTGYYAKLKQYKEKGLYTIAISGKRPDFYKGAIWKDLAPRYATFQKWKNKEIDDFQYTYEYKTWLNSLNKEQIKNDINMLLNVHNDIIFLCYEKEGFCHRHILADWIEENLGMRVEEYV